MYGRRCAHKRGCHALKPRTHMIVMAWSSYLPACRHVDSFLDGLDPQLCLAKMGQPSIRRGHAGCQGRHRGRRLCVHRTAARRCSLGRKLQARGERYKYVGRMRMSRGEKGATPQNGSTNALIGAIRLSSSGAQRHVLKEVIASDLWPVPKYVCRTGRDGTLLRLAQPDARAHPRRRASLSVGLSQVSQAIR